jgi:putative monooxygenase
VEVRVLNPFVDGEELWLGLESEGLRRKVFRVVNDKLVKSEHMAAGLTIFDPGEASSLHSHPESEEIDFIVKGRGDVVSGNERAAFAENSFMFIPKGVEHQHVNTGEEPMWLIWMYTPGGELPTT